jgi:hypothetical protein
LVFLSPPASGVRISADFTFGYECRFLDDRADFENFMNGLWKAESLKFRSIKVSGVPVYFTQPSVYSVPTSKVRRQLESISYLQYINDYFMNNYPPLTPESIEWNRGPVVADQGLVWNVIKTALAYPDSSMHDLMAAADQQQP